MWTRGRELRGRCHAHDEMGGPPFLAFRPDAAQTRAQVYTRSSFTRKLSEEGRMWLDYSIYNQQGNRWIQNSVAVVFADGRVCFTWNVLP